jgi:hypothetical protein
MQHSEFPGLRFETGPHLVLGHRSSVANEVLNHLSWCVKPAIFLKDFGAHQHPRQIEAGMQRLLTDRPVFLTTMNPYVINCVPIESEEAASFRFILVGSEGPPHNFDADQARRFYAAYKAGLQHTSEILLSLGFW